MTTTTKPDLLASLNINPDAVFSDLIGKGLTKATPEMRWVFDRLKSPVPLNIEDWQKISIFVSPLIFKNGHFGCVQDLFTLMLTRAIEGYKEYVSMLGDVNPHVRSGAIAIRWCKEITNLLINITDVEAQNMLRQALEAK